MEGYAAQEWNFLWGRLLAVKPRLHRRKGDGGLRKNSIHTAPVEPIPNLGDATKD